MCSSATCPSPCNTHTGLWVVQDPTHPKCGCRGNSRWLHVSNFLQIPVLISNLVTHHGSWTSTNPQTTLLVSLSYLILATALWLSPSKSTIPISTFSQTLKHSGFPNLTHTYQVADSYLNPVSNAQRSQYLSLEDWLQSLCSSPCACVILTTCKGRTVWFGSSDKDLLKYTFYRLQTSFIHAHPALLSWWVGITKVSDSILCFIECFLVHPSSQPMQLFKDKNYSHYSDEAKIQRFSHLPKHVTKVTWL